MDKSKIGVPLEGLADFGRRVMAEGAVLLRNEKETLPLLETDTVSLFGRCQIDYYRSGTGSRRRGKCGLHNESFGWP